MAQLEAKLPTLRGRKFYGSFRPTPEGEEYFACVVRIGSDDPEKMKVETGAIPGGWFVRRKFPNWEQRLSEMAAVFDDMNRNNDVDPDRPSLEYYRSHAEVLLFVPVRVLPPNSHPGACG
jgi:hypothetical protein